MENASKALIMAGSVLVSVLIIGLLVTMFNNLSNLKQTDQNNEELQDVAEFNKKYEAYNRKMLYGTDIMSIANMVADYNKRESDEKNYTKLKVDVETKSLIDLGNESGFTIISQQKNGTAEEINQDILTLESKIESKGKEVVQGANPSITCAEAYKLSTNELNKKYGVMEGSNGNNFFQYKKLQEGIKTYKRKVFKCAEVRYDEKNTGRINYMKFIEVGN